MAWRYSLRKVHARQQTSWYVNTVHHRIQIEDQHEDTTLELQIKNCFMIHIITSLA